MEAVSYSSDITSLQPDRSHNQLDYEDKTDAPLEGELFSERYHIKDKSNKRKRIRAILNEEGLSSATLDAQQEERDRLKRVIGTGCRGVPSIDSASFYDPENAEQPVEAGGGCSNGANVVDLSSDDEQTIDSLEEMNGSKTDYERVTSEVNGNNVESDNDVICLGSDFEDDYCSSPASTSDQIDDSDDIRGDYASARDGKMLVNIGHPPEDPDILISRYLSGILKPHQLSGIRFMYSNIVESLQRYLSRPGFGCILAHSMGLGKTLQVIAFIDIFYRYTAGKRILILVPINTLANWTNEFNRWLPKKSEKDLITDENVEGRDFDVFLLSEKCRTHMDRFAITQKWFENGGVLLMGYEMFRILTNKDLSSHKKARKNLKTSLSEQALAVAEEQRIARAGELKQMLLEIGPDLVVCDEGHRIKNLQTNTAKALTCIRTRRRIVLTGYPLQNNMFEYWCMVNFVRPNYLGSKHEFANMFERPIKNGQCVDSTACDDKIMRQRVHILTKMLKGFVQRKSHSILKSVLPSKHEFVIFLRKSSIQHALYRRLIIQCRGELTDQNAGCNLLKTFAMCCKIWNHPDILYRVIQGQNVSEQSRLIANDLDIVELPPNLSSAAKPETLSVNQILKSAFQNSSPGDSNSSVSHTLNNEIPQTNNGPLRDESMDFKWAEDIFENYMPGSLDNGFKMLFALSILERCVLIGDKLLLFSQSLLTLDLIEEFLCKNFVPGSVEKWSKNRSYFRLDGSTSSSERELLINRFSQESAVHLFLISTRAGSLGINLVAANRVIVLDASWNPCHDAQAVCRVYRYGQMKPTYIYRLITDNSMERMIFNRQIGKQGMSDRIVDEKAVDALVSRNDLLDVLKYDERLDVMSSDWVLNRSAINDDVLADICEVHKNCLSRQPVPHESLLLDRGDQNLSASEKREAQRNYEREKRALRGSSSEIHSMTKNFIGPLSLGHGAKNEPLERLPPPQKCTPLPLHLKYADGTANRAYRNGADIGPHVGMFPPVNVGPNAVVMHLLSPRTLTLPSTHIPGTVGLVIVGEPVDVIKQIDLPTLVRTSNGHVLDASGSIFDCPLSEIIRSFGGTTGRSTPDASSDNLPSATTNKSTPALSNHSPIEITLSSDDED